MQAHVYSEYRQKLIMTKTNIDSEYLGADTELSPEVLDFFVAKSEVKTRPQACISGSARLILDEYELAMAG